MKSVSQRILAFNEGRLPEMLPLKYAAMAENMFRFYRGTCHLFYEDLSKMSGSVPDAPLTWICGDLHLENFGSFQGQNRLTYFDLNDFDESVLAPATWELARVVTSIFAAFSILELEEQKALNMAQLFLKTYSATLAKGKALYIQPKTAKGIVCDFLTAASKRKARKLLMKKTVKTKKGVQMNVDDVKHREVDKNLKHELLDHITDWIAHSSDSPYNYEALDVAFRIAGTGSLGQHRYVFLLRSLSDDDDFLLIDMKQALPSSVAPYVTAPQPVWTSEAERILAVQQRMQNLSPAMLSTALFKGKHYVLQQLQPEKDSIDFNLAKDRYRDIYQVIDDMALLTASAQLRSTGRQGSDIADALIDFGSRGDWQEGMIKYAIAYSKQVKKDYRDYLKDYKAGILGPVVAAMKKS